MLVQTSTFENMAHFYTIQMHYIWSLHVGFKTKSWISFVNFIKTRSSFSFTEKNSSTHVKCQFIVYTISNCPRRLKLRSLSPLVFVDEYRYIAQTRTFPLTMSKYMMVIIFKLYLIIKQLFLASSQMSTFFLCPC